MTPKKDFHVQIIVVFAAADNRLLFPTQWMAYFEHTLALNNKARLVQNDNYRNENVPTFQFFASWSEVSDVWPQKANSDNPRNHSSIELDAPLGTP
jgi:uncharacterized protein (DUF736 family)